MPLQLRMYITDFLNSIEIINHTESISNNIKENSESVEKVKTEEKENLRDQKKKLSDLLDEYIRPVVEGDGASITLHSFKDGVVSVI